VSCAQPTEKVFLQTTAVVLMESVNPEDVPFLRSQNLNPAPDINNLKRGSPDPKKNWF